MTIRAILTSPESLTSRMNEIRQKASKVGICQTTSFSMHFVDETGMMSGSFLGGNAGMCVADRLELHFPCKTIVQTLSSL